MHKNKIGAIIKKTQKEKFKLREDDIEYIIELANSHPKWSVDRIFEEARRPKIRSCLMLPLTPKLKEAVGKAAKTYQISLSAVACYALREWLKGRKFMK
jgi:hypothetical protein